MFLATLTVMAAAVNPGINQPVTLQPSAVIEFHNTTANHTQSDCVRVMKALSTSKVIAFCSPSVDTTIAAPTATPASFKE